MDGGYTATDYVLQRVLSDHTCKYVTVTNADNWYGSEVVQGVLGYEVREYRGSVRGGGISGGGVGSVRGGVVSKMVTPPLLLAPLDSRNFNIGTCSVCIYCQYQ